jgi:alkylated DNA repair dioxygenase AlkB
MNAIVYDDVISNHDELVDLIDCQEWSNALSRRTQHYGYEYNYKNPRLTACKPIPEFLLKLNADLKSRIPDLPMFDQVIVNEYQTGQRISKHVDNAHLFGDPIVTASLLSDAIMRFKDSINTYDITLKPGSIAILHGYSRYHMTHEILPVNQRRISITFRTVLN